MDLNFLDFEQPIAELEAKIDEVASDPKIHGMIGYEPRLTLHDILTQVIEHFRRK